MTLGAGANNRGLTLVELLVIVGVLSALVAMAIPILASGRMTEREDTALDHLHLLKTAMEQYREDNGNFAAETVILLERGFVSGFQVWGADISRTGYLFHLQPGPTPREWALQANPVNPGYTGKRFFRMDYLGHIRWNIAGPATDTDPPLE
jgi:type IV pilus assembly protein PilA